MRKPDPEVVVNVYLPIMLEALCVTVFIGCSIALLIVMRTPVVPQ